MMWVLRKGWGEREEERERRRERGGERGGEREEGCGDVEMEWNDVKLINVWWKEH